MKGRILVKEIMISPPAELEPSMSILDAVRRLVDLGKSCGIIYRDGKPDGILTDRDVIVKVVAKGADPAKVKVGEVASRPVITVSEDTPLMDAIELFISKRVRKIPVAKGDKIVGLLTEHDVLRLIEMIMETNEEYRRILGL